MNLKKLTRLRDQFFRKYGVLPTHVLVNTAVALELEPDSRPSGLIVVEVDDLSTDIAVGILVYDKP